jgi:hypothetical protein
MGLDTSEYASGFSGSAALQLTAPPSPRHVRRCQAGSSPQFTIGFCFIQQLEVGEAGNLFDVDNRNGEAIEFSSMILVIDDRPHGDGRLVPR